MEKSWGFPMPLSELLPASARRKHGPLQLPPMAANCSSDLSSLAHEQEFMELLWENGQIVLQGQTQRAAKRSLERESAICNPELDLLPPWPNYEDFSLDFLPEIPATVPAHSLSSDPPCDAPRGPDDPPFYGSDVPNFAHFLRASSAAASSGLAELESTLDPGSSTAEEIPARQSSPRPNKKKAHEDAADESSAAEEIPAHQSSPRPNKKKAHEDEADEDVEGESKKPSAKRSRATEVHNQSERRRRDRINEKLKALQELIPNCSKVDKASVLDEAIEYLKTLQMQLQIMSMGGGIYMSPMMISPRMPMGMPMGMAFGMGMIDPNGYPLVLPPPPPLDHPSATIPPPGHGPKYKPPPVPIPRPPPKKVNSPAKTSKNS